MDKIQQVEEQRAQPFTEDTPPRGFGKRFASNSITNLIYFLFSAATSLYMVPFQIDHLGVENYGMVALALSFVSYFQLFAIAISGTVGRFVTLHLVEGNTHKAQGYLNTQFVATSVFSLILLPIISLISYFLPNLVDVPKSHEVDAQLLFGIMLLSFVITQFVAGFQVGTFVRQRFDIRNLIEILNQIARYSVWIVLFAVMEPRLWHIGIGTLAGSMVAMSGHYITFKKLLPKLRLSLRGFEWRKFVEMLKMGGWMTVGQCGIILYMSIDALIINKTLGPHEVGRYGTVLGIALMFRSLSGTMAGLIAPVAVEHYARRDWVGLSRSMARAVKFQSMGLAIPIGIVCGFSMPFVKWWLGPELASVHVLLWIMLAHLVVNSGLDPLYGITYAANRVAVPGIVTVVGGLIKVVASLWLIDHTKLGVESVALATVIAFTLKELVFMPMYIRRIMGESSRNIYKSLIPAPFAFAFIAGMASIAAQELELDTFIKLFVCGSFIAAVSGAVIYRFGLDKEDRVFLAKALKRRRAGQ